MLCLASKILLSTGANLPPAVAKTKDVPGYASASYCNQRATSLFRDLQILINDIPIMSSVNNYPILAYLETLLFYSKAYKDSKSEIEGYFTAKSPSDTNALGYDAFAMRYKKS